LLLPYFEIFKRKNTRILIYFKAKEFFMVKVLKDARFLKSLRLNSNIKTMLLVLLTLLVVALSGIKSLINNKKEKVSSNVISSKKIDVNYNNVFSKPNTIQISENVNDNTYNYSFYKKDTNEKLFDINSKNKLNAKELLNGGIGLNASLVGAGLAIAAGGSAGAVAGVTAAVKVGQLVQGAAWLTQGSLSAASTLQLAGALAVTANPVGAALAVAGVA
jgi:hypothetical protein